MRIKLKPVSRMLRPTGVIRTLPYYGAGHTKEAKAKRLAYRRMMKTFKRMETDDNQTIRIAFSVMPTREVLHCYILVEGKIRVRANISHWEAGKGEAVESFDGHDLSDAKFWAILTGPVSWPRETMECRGFQGVRYTEELW